MKDQRQVDNYWQAYWGERFKSENFGYQRRNAALKAQVRDLTQQAKTWQGWKLLLEETQATNRTLEAALREATAAREAAEADATEYRNERDRLLQDVTDTVDRADKAEARVIEAQQETAAYARDLALLQADRDKAEAELAVAREALTEIAEERRFYTLEESQRIAAEALAALQDEATAHRTPSAVDVAFLDFLEGKLTVAREALTEIARARGSTAKTGGDVQRNRARVALAALQDEADSGTGQRS